MEFNEIIDSSIFSSFRYIDRCLTLQLDVEENISLPEGIIYLLEGSVDFSYTNFFGEELTLPLIDEPRFLSVAYKAKKDRCRLRAHRRSYLLVIPYDLEEALEEDPAILKCLYRGMKENQTYFMELYKENFVKKNFGTTEQIAYFLIQYSDSEGRVSLDRHRGVLARYSIKRSMFYRILDQLADEGAIMLRGDSVEIVNTHYLEELLKNNL